MSFLRLHGGRPDAAEGKEEEDQERERVEEVEGASIGTHV